MPRLFFLIGLNKMAKKTAAIASHDRYRRHHHHYRRYCIQSRRHPNDTRYLPNTVAVSRTSKPLEYRVHVLEDTTRQDNRRLLVLLLLVLDLVVPLVG